MFAAVQSKTIAHVDFNDLFISLIKALLVFNLIDGLFTLAYLELGYAVEANPIMAYYYALSPLWFMLAKNFLMASGCFILHQFIGRPISKVMISCGWFSYLGILIYHLTFLGYWINTQAILPI